MAKNMSYQAMFLTSSVVETRSSQECNEITDSTNRSLILWIIFCDTMQNEQKCGIGLLK